MNLNESIETSENDAEQTAPSDGRLAPSAPITTQTGDPIWKVLVFDDLGRDVISSVLRVNDLRSIGVTMHM